MKVIRQYTYMTVIAAMTVIFVACSSDNDLVTNANVSEPSTVRTITFTAGPLGGDAETRATLTDKRTTIQSAWEVDDVVGVTYTNEEGKQFTTGKVTAVTEGVATISAEIEGKLVNGNSFFLNYPAFDNEQYATFTNSMLTNQIGTLEDIQDNWAYFNGSADVSDNAAPANIKMRSRSAIWKLTFKSNGTDITEDIKSLKIQWEDKDKNSFTYTVTPSSQEAIYVSLSDSYTPNADSEFQPVITLTATTKDDKKYVITKNAKTTFGWGKFYQSEIAFTDLSAITENYTAKDGETLTGTLSENVKLSVADGATVTLSNVTVEGSDNSYNEHPGIKCLGDATIILTGENTVTGTHNGSGIYVPQNKTLEIKGSGSLTASSSSSGAGIGAYYSGYACGNIWIQGGTITATGGEMFAGIGGGDQGDSCGNITISGGTVNATGGKYAAGIGTGRGTRSSHSSCGDIFIGGDVIKVVANKGDDAPYSIGRGYSDERIDGEEEYSECGTITIDGVEYEQSYFNVDSYVLM